MSGQPRLQALWYSESSLWYLFVSWRSGNSPWYFPQRLGIVGALHGTSPDHGIVAALRGSASDPVNISLHDPCF